MASSQMRAPGRSPIRSRSQFLDLYTLDQVARETFTADIHVGEVEISRHDRQVREKLVSEGVPEIKHAMIAQTSEVRTEDGACFAP